MFLVPIILWLPRVTNEMMKAAGNTRLVQHLAMSVQWLQHLVSIMKR